jgi:DNA-binding transcriptional ArsR family regulator
MGSFEDWLARMPVDDVRQHIAALEGKIAELERQADVMRLLVAQHDSAESRPSAPPPSAVMRRPSPRISDARTRNRRADRRARRLSPEREAILRVLREHPGGMAPVDVAKVLDKAPNAVQTNLSRMTQAEMVVRVGTGLYRLPPADPTEGAHSSNGNGTMTLDQPSGSEGEAMEP